MLPIEPRKAVELWVKNNPENAMVAALKVRPKGRAGRLGLVLSCYRYLVGDGRVKKWSFDPETPFKADVLIDCQTGNAYRLVGDTIFCYNGLEVEYYSRTTMRKLPTPPAIPLI